MEMLRRKEAGDIAQYEHQMMKKDQAYGVKRDVQAQMVERERLREDAYKEYVAERQQVDNVINRMIEEDLEMMRLQKTKQEQSKQDMIISNKEKMALL